MFKGLLGKRKTSKFDVVMALSAAVVAVWKAVDTARDYREDHNNEENEK